jgi:histidinol-phosphate phosphatase family protein
MVIPTVGRASLRPLLDALATGDGPAPERIFLVDDRRDRSTPLVPGGVPSGLAALVTILPGHARGPAVARNLGWRASRAAFVAFLDDDVVPDADWRSRLAEDVAALPQDAAASQGVLLVPLPETRPATDWERNVKRLETAQWATADMVYRRAALEAVGGFDERFRRAYREDADLALRVTAAGWRIARGTRRATHPVRAAGRWISVAKQAGNADDVLMRAVHGARWRERAGEARGRRPAHLATTAAGVLGAAALLAGRRTIGIAGLGLWLGGTLEFAWTRIAPGPRTRVEVMTMLATSAVIPAAATYHWIKGWVTLFNGHHPFRWTDALKAPLPPETWPRAVLLDRDGTLVVDVPHNGDPERVVPVPGAREALDRLRAAGMSLAVVSNQSGVARGLISIEQVHAVNRRVEELLGRLGPWFFCPHAPADACGCRKPAPGLVRRAAAALGVRPEECVVIGDTGGDVGAARAAGARAILVPTPVTRREEIDAAPEVAADLESAVDRLLGTARVGT